MVFWLSGWPAIKTGGYDWRRQRLVEIDIKPGSGSVLRRYAKQLQNPLDTLPLICFEDAAQLIDGLPKHLGTPVRQFPSKAQAQSIATDRLVR